MSDIEPASIALALAEAVAACLPSDGYTITDLHPETAHTEETR